MTAATLRMTPPPRPTAAHALVKGVTGSLQFLGTAPVGEYFVTENTNEPLVVQAVRAADHTYWPYQIMTPSGRETHHEAVRRGLITDTRGYELAHEVAFIVSQYLKARVSPLKRVCPIHGHRVNCGANTMIVAFTDRELRCHERNTTIIEPAGRLLVGFVGTPKRVPQKLRVYSSYQHPVLTAFVSDPD